MRKTNLSYATLSSLLDQLQKLGMLNFDVATKKVETTDKGLDFLKRHAALIELLQ